MKAGLGTQVTDSTDKVIKKTAHRIPHDFRRTATLYDGSSHYGQGRGFELTNVFEWVLLPFGNERYCPRCESV